MGCQEVGNIVDVPVVRDPRAGLGAVLGQLARANGPAVRGVLLSQLLPAAGDPSRHRNAFTARTHRKVRAALCKGVEPV
eukprot:scaffold1827_cov421-Prasinococcus_capsulatus_cf.AAC.47